MKEYNTSSSSVLQPAIQSVIESISNSEMTANQSPDETETTATSEEIATAPTSIETPTTISMSDNNNNHSDLPQGLINETECLPKYKRDLTVKLKSLRAELTAMQPQSGHCRIEVSRGRILEESYR